MSWAGWSFKWYYALFQNPLLMRGFMVSIKIASLSATFAMILGTLCASQWGRNKSAHPHLVWMASLSLVIPEIVMGLALLLFWVAIMKIFPQLTRGFWSIFVAHTTLGTAYVTAIVRSRIVSIDPALSEAAMDLGARPYKVFLAIKLPLLMPALASGWLLAFILSFDDVVLASFTSGPGYTTLPLVIFSYLKIGYTPQINALGSLIILTISLLMAGIWYIIYRRGSSFEA
ncbi:MULTISPECIES: ABC transporter permease [Holospora]|uniref:Putrescine transport system permease protein PotI n=2 Tax=Holospora TaxID=44747 RepID=A0A061JFV3_9PROT|nr:MULTISPECIES: ABC transporter permease [Holospora]ETZ04570.1 putrescine transport system permease protein PotI [Holospora undulata HU1]GAJ45790.1 putrescine transport system permease protein PotI [Holospora elegans E1]